MEFYIGNATCLDVLLETDGLYLLEPKETSRNGYCRVNLGRRRIRNAREGFLLAWVGNDSVTFEKIGFDNPDSGMEMRPDQEGEVKPYFDLLSFLKKKKVKYRCTTDLGGYRSSLYSKWESVLNRYTYYGMFCVNGYAVQHSYWFDAWMYNWFIWYAYGKEMLILDGVSITEMAVQGACDELMTPQVMELLKKSYSTRHAMSWKDFGEYMEAVGLGIYKKYIGFKHTLTAEELEAATEGEIVAGIPLYTYYGNVENAVSISWDA